MVGVRGAGPPYSAHLFVWLPCYVVTGSDLLNDWTCEQLFKRLRGGSWYHLNPDHPYTKWDQLK